MLKAQDGIFYNLSPSFSILSSGLHSLHTGDSDQTVVYPNPASNQIVIDELPDDGAIAVIVDIHGRIIASHQLFQTRETINVSHLSSGVYTLVISRPNNEPHSTHRLIIKKES